MRTKLTIKIQNAICRHLKNGMSVKNSMKMVGIHESTFYGWMSRGEKETKGVYFEFCEAVEKAKAESEKKLVDIIRGAAEQGEWKPAAWMLERRFPDQWGRIDRLDISGKLKTEDDTGPLTDEVIDARNQYLKAVSNAKKQQQKDDKK